jgi:hypothetical protein
VRSSSSLSVFEKRVRTNTLFYSQFCPYVPLSDIEKSKGVVQACFSNLQQMKAKFDSCASFHISVTEGGFRLITNIDIWPFSCV